MNPSAHPALNGSPGEGLAQPAPAGRRRSEAGKVPRLTRVDRRLAWRLQQSIGRVGVGVVLWDGSALYSASTPAVGHLVIGDRRTLLGLIVHPELWFGEAYMSGRLGLRGSIEPIVEALSRLSAPASPWIEKIRAVFTASNTLTAARRNVHHHYDLGNAFYQLWLDTDLVYTCAYFADEQMSLERAQQAKLDLVCRKLNLRAGDTVVEAGCGWGALALYMARVYGARVRAFNVSQEQLAYARDRARRDGLADRVEFIDDDYRNVKGEFDAFVSVGMLEHVGLRQFATLAEVLGRTVRRQGGRGLLHFIGRDAPRPLNAWIVRRIFPGAYPPTLSEVTTGILTPAGMSVVDVENLRLHYARTLVHWRERFEIATEAIRGRYGDQFQRAWELYLAGSQAAFATGWMQLFQVVFAPFESTPPHWTRSEVYRAGDERPCSSATF